ncbi:CDP-alcohol phosphatidyltransferase [Desulfurococcus amylolyticus 1221n]|uniref:Archaetidylinositol phosphate synthase n=1 Tax=Desulfurococcus amylolyticus (strain DSM 18924 / JCM 16383 / VKM B-2413 / 1221n) TaxID=490899 RepID=B8D5D0_DESA1|nr:CDP-alcohol phosphatidyltransferase [Desulfurococcus amylolyticus 1221n]
MNTVAKPFIVIGVPPNVLTASSMMILLIGAFFFAFTTDILLYLVFITVSSILDALDGAVARAMGKASRFGAFLDSTVDRVNDAILILSLGFLRLNQLYILVFLVASFLVSYIRARAESLGVGLAGIGLIERPERILGVILVLASYRVSPRLAEALLSVLTILSVVTVVQRIMQVYRRINAGN